MVARRRPIVFDFDDAIWLPRENRMNPLARFLKFQGKTAAIAKMSSAVLAGNDYLARWARGVQPNVHVVPSTIETAGEYARVRKERRPERLVIGWSGSFSTLPYLIGIRPMLEALRQVVPFSLRVICNGPPLDWPALDLAWRPWSSATEVDDLLDLDIGLMPQPDDEWTRGKCGMKALQYMALGIVPVTSRSGVLPEIIEDGVSGRLAATPDEWLAALQSLAADAEARARMGRRARETVERRFSAAVHAPRVAVIVRDVVAGRRRPGGGTEHAGQPDHARADSIA
jgi:glycosyltransferase involved in cell wall biosynthesis